MVHRHEEPGAGRIRHLDRLSGVQWFQILGS